MVNSLGVFTFVRLTGVNGISAPPHVQAQVSEVIQRPGINGSAVRRNGVKGTPFQMLSRTWVDSVPIGQQILRAYQNEIGAFPLTLVWNGFNYENFQTRYVVLGVQSQELFAIRNAVENGVALGNVAWLEAIWTLLPVSM